MARKIALVARRDFEFKGQQYVAGEAFEAEAVIAVLHLHAGRARFARGHDLAPVAPETPKPRRRYRRRDLTAEE